MYLLWQACSGSNVFYMYNGGAWVLVAQLVGLVCMCTCVCACVCVGGGGGGGGMGGRVCVVCVYGYIFICSGVCVRIICIWHCSECGMGLSQHSSGPFRPRLCHICIFSHDINFLQI